MNFEKVYNFLKGTAALGGLMAFVGFSYTYYKDVSAREAAAARSWQSVEIFSIAINSGEKGVTLAELVSGVQGSFINGKHFDSIDPNIATENQVLRGIVELASKNSIIMGTDGRYRVPFQFASFVSQDVKNVLIAEYQNRVLEEVNAHPGKFTSEDLRAMLRRDGAKELDIQRAIMPLVLSGPWGPPMLVPSENNPRGPDVPPHTLKLEMMR